MAGQDRYFGGHEGAARRARARMQTELGVVKGTQRFEETLDARREAYAGKGRGTALQALVSGEDPGPSEESV